MPGGPCYGSNAVPVKYAGLEPVLHRVLFRRDHHTNLSLRYVFLCIVGIILTAIHLDAKSVTLPPIDTHAFKPPVLYHRAATGPSPSGGFPRDTSLYNRPLSLCGPAVKKGSSMAPPGRVDGRTKYTTRDLIAAHESSTLCACAPVRNLFRTSVDKSMLTV